MQVSEQAVDDVVAIAQEAGVLLKKGFRGDRRVEHKGAIDLVTDFDLAAERLIRARLGEAFPDVEVLGEESINEADAVARLERGAPAFVVDPIDGTTNFAHGHPFFAVSIGLVEAGRALLGVVHAPELGTTWSARHGGPLRRDGVTVCRGEVPDLRSAVVASGFPYDRAESADNNAAEFAAIMPQVRGVRRCGSAAIDLALTADGTYAGYWEQKLKPWDVAAGLCLIESSGAVVTDYDGGDFRFARGRLVAGQAGIVSALRSEIAKARAKAQLD